MNIDKSPIFTCLTSASNPYIDRVSFKPPLDTLSRRMQTTFLLDRISNLTNTVPYILSVLDGKPCPFYTKLMKAVEENPKLYKCTPQELQNAYGITFQIYNAIGADYNKNKKINEKVFQNGITVFNEKYFEDVCNGKLNSVLFVDGMRKTAEDLKIYKTTANILEK